MPGANAIGYFAINPITIQAIPLLTAVAKNTPFIGIPVVASIDGRILRRRLKADGTPENIPMYPFEINSRLSELGLLDYSAKVLAESELDDLDPDEVKRLKDTIANNPGGEKMLLELSDDELLKALHFVKTEETGEIRPTVAGILMVGREESIKRLMPTEPILACLLPR